MARSGIQKAEVVKAELPDLDVLPDNTAGYFVRYRIVSEDRNSYSHWSPIYAVTDPNPGEVIVVLLDGGEES
jgi:hypothetical protein